MTGLAVPTPAQVAPGNFLTAALWNANIYNGLTFLLNPPLFHGLQITAQSVSASTWTAIALDSTTVDSYGGHSNTTNSSRYTAQVAGWYQVSGVLAINTNATGFRAARLQINGAALPASDSYANNMGTNNTTVTTPTRLVFLNAGDYVELAGWQNSGGALSTSVLTEFASALNVLWVHA